MPRPLAPGENQPEHDLIMTPRSLARTIISHFAPQGNLLDPAAGEGAFELELEQYGEVYSCELSRGTDFFSSNPEIKFDWIITNPPWSKMRRFLSEAFIRGNNVVYLATLTHFITRARLNDIANAGFGLKEALCVPEPSPPWPPSGFQLAAVHLQRGWTSAWTINRSLLGVTQTSSTAEELGL